MAFGMQQEISIGGTPAAGAGEREFPFSDQIEFDGGSHITSAEKVKCLWYDMDQWGLILLVDGALPTGPHLVPERIYQFSDSRYLWNIGQGRGLHHTFVFIFYACLIGVPTAFKFVFVPLSYLAYIACIRAAFLDLRRRGRLHFYLFRVPNADQTRYWRPAGYQYFRFFLLFLFPLVCLGSGSQLGAPDGIGRLSLKVYWIAANLAIISLCFLVDELPEILSRADAPSDSNQGSSKEVLSPE